MHVINIPPKRVYVMAIAALTMIEAVSSIPQITLRDVPRAARMEADQRI